jgi:hypothetical protein
MAEQTQPASNEEPDGPEALIAFHRRNINRPRLTGSGVFVPVRIECAGVQVQPGPSGLVTLRVDSVEGGRHGVFDLTPEQARHVADLLNAVAGRFNA